MATENSGHMAKNQTMRRLSNGNVAASMIFADSSQQDAFKRLRVSSPFSLFESTHQYDIEDKFNWEQDTNGVGASITHLPEESGISLNVGTANGEFSILQTQKYFTYHPGRSQLLVLTGVMDSGKDNLVQRQGLFDDNDGVFFECDGVITNLVIRSSASGVIVENRIPQSQWNVDRVDGSKGIFNPSKIKLDITNGQVFVIDLQWLGFGRVRFCLDVGDQVINLHEANHANSQSIVYMRTATLPIRYEIRNTGIADSSSSLKAQCSTIIAEGGQEVAGIEFSTGNGIVLRSLVATTRTPILAIRNALTFNGVVNRATTVLSLSSAFVSATCFLELAYIHNVTATAGGTWAGVDPGHSVVEFNAGITSITGSEHVFKSGYVPAGQGAIRVSAAASPLPTIGRHNELYLNKAGDVSDILVVYATTITGTAEVGASMDWVEQR